MRQNSKEFIIGTGRRHTVGLAAFVARFLELMIMVSLRLNVVAICVLISATSIFSSGVAAQDAGAQVSGKRVPITKLAPAVVAEFKANPQSLLTSYPSAGPPLASKTRDLVLTDNGLIGALIAVAKNGNDAQQSAIGAGIAQALLWLANENPALTAQIQEQIAQSGLTQLITSFIASSDSLATTAIGSGGAGAGGGGGVAAGRGGR